MVTNRLKRTGLAGAAIFALAAVGLPGVASATQPQPWEINLQPAATPIMEMIHSFNFGVLVVMGLIVVFVLALLLYCIVRFNVRANPVPSRTTHNTLIEVVWTVVPILILVGIAVPSFALLFAEHDPRPRHRRLRSGQGRDDDHQGDRQPVVLVLQLSG